GDANAMRPAVRRSALSGSGPQGVREPCPDRAEMWQEFSGRHLRLCLLNRCSRGGSRSFSGPRGADAAGLERLPRTAQGGTLAVHQPVDLLDQRHVLCAIIAPPAAALERLEHRELLFPVAEHVLADAERARDFTDRAQCARFLAVVETRGRAGIAHDAAAMR